MEQCCKGALFIGHLFEFSAIGRDEYSVEQAHLGAKPESLHAPDHAFRWEQDNGGLRFDLPFLLTAVSSAAVAAMVDGAASCLRFVVTGEASYFASIVLTDPFFCIFSKARQTADSRSCYTLKALRQRIQHGTDAAQNENINDTFAGQLVTHVLVQFAANFHA